MERKVDRWIWLDYIALKDQGEGLGHPGGSPAHWEGPAEVVRESVLMPPWTSHLRGVPGHQEETLRKSQDMLALETGFSKQLEEVTKAMEV